MRRVLRALVEFLASCRPVTLVVLGYASYMFLGWLALCLPFAAERDGATALDHLFTAVSAVSTTGLVTVDPGTHYTFFGELVILLLIQLGGVGYMTIGSFVVLARQQPLTPLRQRISLQTFCLPDGCHLETFLYHVVIFTAAVEFLGAAALYALFARAGVEHPLWPAVFHSVSAFCTAGFSLFPNSLEDFRGDVFLNATVAALSYLGAVGFIVMLDLWRVVTRKAESITFTSRIILHVTLWLSALGTAGLFLIDPGLHALPPEQRLLAAFFQAMTALTTVGFDTVPMSALAAPALYLLVLLMLCGASPSGTGGGLKSTTLSALVGLARSTARGLDRAWLFGRPIPEDRVRVAATNFALYLATFGTGLFVLTLTESAGFLDLAFEAASAIGTVGLSMGATAGLSPLGKLAVCALMFAGRAGPQAMAASFFLPRRALAGGANPDVAV
ncbi:MAG: potassium transporter KtrB [Planctomycetota bacterium]|nr:potassium transporter KtrB [Planctomycetota bacterium]